MSNPETESFHRQLIERATLRGRKRPDDAAECARHLLSAIRGHLDRREPLSPTLSDYFGRALDAILERGSSADDALGLVRPAKRPVSDGEFDAGLAAFLILTDRLRRKPAAAIALNFDGFRYGTSTTVIDMFTMPRPVRSRDSRSAFAR